ncbi:hypothetical protein PHPALM_30698 [Phytophthora palmivora]|uniref:Uncharacterized protein n=1 Tax=Phytophthora palmivora TaxID=4796 RepID=A0A2P4X4H4_9STRA|nr:hypothetical protein PHPALM_30698 [Phytophthora palmivora]
MAVTLATQDALCAPLLDQVLGLVSEDNAKLDTGTPARGTGPAFDARVRTANAIEPPGTSMTTVATPDSKRWEGSVQDYLNRHLKGVAGIVESLPTRRHILPAEPSTIEDDRLASQWISDRDVWDRTMANNVFVWMRGKKGCEAPNILGVSAFAYTSKERLGRLSTFLFSPCTTLKHHDTSLSTKVLNVLTAYLVRYYYQSKELASTAPFAML